MATDDQALKDAQYRKGLSIAYFNSINASIELARVLFNNPDILNDEYIKKFISEWRDWFLEEHKQHYLKTISNAGLPFDIAATLKRFDDVKTMTELQLTWQTISEDERHNKDVIKLVSELKDKFSKK